MDDDVTLIDIDCLEKIEYLFNNSDVDVIGAMELHHKADIESYLANQSAYTKNDIINLLDNSTIGQLDKFYNLTTGFEKFIDQPQGIYLIQSFRSCFMAYRRSVLFRLINWDSNYCRVGSRIGVREETDFLLRCRNAGFNVHYTNITAIWHRTGERDKSLIARDKGMKRHFYYAAAHSYMAMKDMIETGYYIKIIPWIIFQMFLGSFKNPGLLTIIKNYRSITATIFNLAGFIWGFLFAVFRSRRLLSDYQKYISTPRQ